MNKHSKEFDQLNKSRRIFDQWPAWKKEFLITEYSEKVKNRQSETEVRSSQTNADLCL